MANLGIARMLLDTDALTLQLDEMITISTEKKTNKSVRQNSDDLRRARELQIGFHSGIRDCSVVFAEIPQGSQHSRSAFGFGMAVCLLASCPVPLIEVQPE